MVDFAVAIDTAGLSWRRAGQRMKVTGDHVARILKGKHCGSDTRIKAFQEFGVMLNSWDQEATPEECERMEGLMRSMEGRRNSLKGKKVPS